VGKSKKKEKNNLAVLPIAANGIILTPYFDEDS